MTSVLSDSVSLPLVLGHVGVHGMHNVWSDWGLENGGKGDGSDDCVISLLRKDRNCWTSGSRLELKGGSGGSKREINQINYGKVLI